MVSTGPAPQRVLTSSHGEGVDQRTSSWVVAISRYEEPASSYTPHNDPAKAQRLQIIENDAIAVTTSSNKSGFGKTANVRMKISNVWYPSLVNNGDWICIWMHSDKTQNDRITNALETLRDGGDPGTTLCDASSGLKFVGRITNISNSDSIGGNGQRSITQSIQAQMFLELASSIYYIFKAPVAAVPTVGPSKRSAESQKATENAVIENYQTKNGLDTSLQNLAQKFLDFYKSNKPGSQAPDNLVALFFIIIMGIDSDAESGVVGVKGTVNDGITQTQDISRILGRPKAKKLWELYNLYLGLQKYSNSGEWWERFSPALTSPDSINDGSVVKQTTIRTKGFVPFTPTMWSNESMWSILTKYINSVCNEMYTCLRVNEKGVITPTLVHREKPFSTGLYDYLTKEGKVDPSLEIKSKGATKPSSISGFTGRVANTTDKKVEAATRARVLGGSDDRTMYSTLPRWVIDESIIRSFSYSMDESSRINFVQVWGRNAAAEFTGGALTPEQMKQSALAAGNFYTDEVDVARHGLRAMILESNYDVYNSSDASGSLAPLWARMNADWHFNGHLKASASLTINGVVDPICEGDNLQVRDLVFHIEGVSHNCSIASNGRKTWTTSLQLSRGMLAAGLAEENSVPLFITHGASRSFVATQDSDSVPGVTQVQNRITGKAQTGVN